MLQSNPEFSLLLLYHIIVGGRTPPFQLVSYNFIISRKIHPNNISWYSAPFKGMGGLGQNKLFLFILIYVIALSLFFHTLVHMFLNNEDFLFCGRLMVYRLIGGECFKSLIIRDFDDVLKNPLRYVDLYLLHTLLSKKNQNIAMQDL